MIRITVQGDALYHTGIFRKFNNRYKIKIHTDRQTDRQTYKQTAALQNSGTDFFLMIYCTESTHSMFKDKLQYRSLNQSEYIFTQ